MSLAEFRQPDRPLLQRFATRQRYLVPAPLLPLVGREQDCAYLLEQVQQPECRLLTLVGPGGIGKTRLAIEIAASLVAQGEPGAIFPAGVYVVELPAALHDADDGIAQAIAAAIGLSFGHAESPSGQVLRFLQDKRMLVVLDTADDVLALAPFVSAMLQRAEGLTILATARERLRIRGEWLFNLEPLSYPENEAGAGQRSPSAPGGSPYGAVAMFLQAARMQLPNWNPDASEMGQIERICRLVAGLPLGIELAAGWISTLSCTEIALEIERSLDFLEAGAADRPARQQSLRAAFESSWSHLNAVEQQALRRLSVLRGQFTREAALAIGGASLATLNALVTKSLLQRVPHAAPTSRYRLLAPLRAYAAVLLEAAGEAEAVHARHRAFFLDLLAGSVADLLGAQQQATLASLDAQLPDIRQAWQAAVDALDTQGLRHAADGLFYYCEMRSYFQEGWTLFDAARRALQPGAADAAVRGVIEARAGWFAFHIGRHAEARHMLEQAIAWLEAPAHPAERVFALNYLAAVSAYLGEYQATEACCAESLALAAQLGDLHGRVVALSILCQSNADRGDLAAARQWGEQSLALEHQLGSPGSLAFSLANLGKVLAAGGDHAGAAVLFRQSLAARQSIGDLRGVATCLDMLGSVTIAQGRAGEGVNSYLESLALFREIGDIWGAASVLRALAAFAAQRAELPVAAALLDEATRLALETGARPLLHAIVQTWLALPAEISAELAGVPGAHYGDPEAIPALAARILSQRSIHAAAGLKLDTALERVRALAQPEQPQPAPAPRPQGARPGGLTAREWEVLHLVAEGLTDAQIAERLVLSRRTVTSYLTSVYSKLGVNSRSAATRWMLEQRFRQE